MQIHLIALSNITHLPQPKLCNEVLQLWPMTTINIILGGTLERHKLGIILLHSKNIATFQGNKKHYSTAILVLGHKSGTQRGLHINLWTLSLSTKDRL